MYLFNRVFKVFHREKLWTNMSVQTSHNIYRKMGGEYDRRNGEMDTGFSTLRTLLLTPLCLCRNLWPIMVQLLCNIPASQISVIFLFLFWKPSWHWRKIFHYVSRIQEQQQDTLADFQIKKVTKCFQQSCNHWDHCVKPQGDQFEGGSMEQHFKDVIIHRNTVQKRFGHTSFHKHSPECRRTTMMHVVASSDPRIFTFSAKKAQVMSVLAVVVWVVTLCSLQNRYQWPTRWCPSPRLHCVITQQGHNL